MKSLLNDALEIVEVLFKDQQFEDYLIVVHGKKKRIIIKLPVTVSLKNLEEFTVKQTSIIRVDFGKDTVKIVLQK